MDGRNSSNPFVDRFGDGNGELSFLPEDSMGQFEYPEKQHELKSKAASVREMRYDYHSIAPYKRPPKTTGHPNIARNSHHRQMKHRSGKYSRSIPFDEELLVNRKQAIYGPDDRINSYQSEHPAKIGMENPQVRDYDGIVDSQRFESGKKYTLSAGLYEQTRDDIRMNFPNERDVGRKISSAYTVPSKRDMTDPSTSPIRLGRNANPRNPSIDPRFAKMTSPPNKFRENIRTGQSKSDDRSSVMQSNKDNHSPPKNDAQPEKRPSLSVENARLKKAVEKSEMLVSHYEDLWKKRKSQLAQATQVKEDLQKQIAELDKQKESNITDLHQHYVRAKAILKLQSQFDERVDLLAGFLNNQSKLKETIASCTSADGWVKLQEMLKFYQKSRKEIEMVKRTCYASSEKLHQSVGDACINALEESDMQQLRLEVSNSLALCREKKIEMQTRCDAKVAEIAEVKAKIDNVTTNMDRERDQMKAKFIGLYQRAQREIGLLREKKNTVKNEVIEEIAGQREILASFEKEYRETKAEIERLSIENRDIQKDIGDLVQKRGEIVEELSSIESELKELTEKQKISRDQLKSKTNQNESLVKTKKEELEAKKREKLLLETKKNDLIKKLEYFRSLNENKTKLSQLQDKLNANAQAKQTLQETITSLKNEQQVKESRVKSMLETERAMKEEKLELLRQVQAFDDSKSAEKEVRTSILNTMSRIRGQEESAHEATQRRLSSSFDKILVTASAVANFEQQYDIIFKENAKLDGICETRKIELQKIAGARMDVESEILKIKKFVRNGAYTTVQSLNGRIKDAVKMMKAEEIVVNALEEEIMARQKLIQATAEGAKLAGKRQI